MADNTGETPRTVEGIIALRASHDHRVTELLDANTREVERRRKVERALHEIANDSGFGAHARMRAIARKALAQVDRQGGSPDA